MVVGRWEELNKNLANDTNTRFLYIFIQRHVVEVFDDIMYQFTESATAIFHATDGCMFPFAVQLIDRSLYLLVWTSLVDNAHEQISDCERLHRAFDRLHIPYETGVILKALYGEGNHRNLWVAGLRKCTTDKANVVCCTAATAGLCHNKCQFIDVIFAGCDGMHHLTYNDQRRIAGIVVYIF